MDVLIVVFFFFFIFCYVINAYFVLLKFQYLYKFIIHANQNNFFSFGRPFCFITSCILMEISRTLLCIFIFMLSVIIKKCHRKILRLLFIILQFLKFFCLANTLNLNVAN